MQSIWCGAVPLCNIFDGKCGVTSVTARINLETEFSTLFIVSTVPLGNYVRERVYARVRRYFDRLTQANRTEFASIPEDFFNVDGHSVEDEQRGGDDFGV